MCCGNTCSIRLKSPISGECAPWPPAREEVNVQAAFLGVIAALFLVEGLTPIGMIDVSVAAVPLALALVFAAWAIHSTWTDGPRR